MAEGQAGDPGRNLEEEEENRVWVGHRAFDELLDCAERAEQEGEATGEGEMRRRMFAIAVNRAVKKALARPDPDGESRWLTQTLKRYRCRIYFHRHEGVLHIVACIPLYPHLEGAVNTS